MPRRGISRAAKARLGRLGRDLVSDRRRWCLDSLCGGKVGRWVDGWVGVDCLTFWVLCLVVVQCLGRSIPVWGKNLNASNTCVCMGWQRTYLSQDGGRAVRFSFETTPDWVGSRCGNRDKRILNHDRVRERGKDKKTKGEKRRAN